MKKILLRLNLLITMLAVSAGFIILGCAFFGRLPKNVTVNGVEVGGKTRTEAAQLIRGDIISGLKEKRLTVTGGKNDYTFAYPEIYFKDNVQKLLKGVTKSGEYFAEVSFYLNGIDEITQSICKNESTSLVEPFAIFNTEGEAFTYVEGNDGVYADEKKLAEDIRASLSGGFDEVSLSFKKVARTKSLLTVKYDTRIISSFTTFFDGANTDRRHNIALAAQKINGTVIENGQSFSFNGVVGQRTKERGFRTAKIIENGKFVQGVGGGVCQVSTTLFNAALLAGCTMTEFHAHSLAVGYVPPSFDAMVSGDYYDLKFKNNTGHKLYIRATTKQNSVSFFIYGRGDGAQYDFSSVVTGNIAAPVEKTNDSSLIADGKDGVISEGYLTVTRNGVKTTKLFRHDKYAPVKRVELDAPEEEPPEQAQ